MKIREFFETKPIDLQERDIVYLVSIDGHVDTLPIFKDEHILNGEVAISLDYHGHEIITSLASLVEVKIWYVQRVEANSELLYPGDKGIRMVWSTFSGLNQKGASE